MHSLSNPCDRKIFRAYKDCPDDAIPSATCSVIEKLSERVTPSTFRDVTLSMPTSIVTVLLFRSRGFENIILNVFFRFRQRLLLLPAHFSTLFSSSARTAVDVAGRNDEVDVVCKFEHMVSWSDRMEVGGGDIEGTWPDT